MRTAAAALLIVLLLPAFACHGADDLFSVRVWVSIDPVQCDGNPWDSSGVTVEAYYEGLGVDITTSVSVQIDDNTCLACSCPTGFRIYLEIDESSLLFMIGQGFELTVEPK